MTWHLRHRFLVPLSHAVEHCQIVLGTLTMFYQNLGCAFLHSASGLPLKPRELTQPLCQGSLEEWGRYWHLQQRSTNGGQDIVNKYTGLISFRWAIWATFYRAPQRIPSRIDPWLLRSLTHSVALLAFPLLSCSPCLLCQLFVIYLPNKLPTSKFLF